jgi:hypothetical protein
VIYDEVGWAKDEELFSSLVAAFPGARAARNAATPDATEYPPARKYVRARRRHRL